MDEHFKGTVDGGDSYPKWEKGGGVRFAAALRTISHPDDLESLDYCGMMTRLFVRNVPRPDLGYLNHVVCDHVGDDLRIVSALKIHEDTHPNLASMRPLDMLSAFLTRLDSPPVILVGEAFRLIAMRSLRVKNRGRVELGLGQQVGKLETVARWKMSEDQSRVQVSYGWGMNFTAYRRHLTHRG